jgi:glycosyltransferase involved in cell wall biosynthesis
MPAKKRRWAINGDFVTLKPTGVARYAREVTLALDALAHEEHPLTRDLEFRLLAPRPPADLPLNKIPTTVIPEFRTPRLPQVWAQFQLPRHATDGLVSFCNLAPAFKRRHIACIHDLHTRLMPKSYSFGFRLAHRIILPLIGLSARAVTTVSSLSREHLVRYGVAAEHKIHVTYNGCDHARRWDRGASRLELPAERPFVFCLGQPQDYKNTELLWKIAPALDRMQVDILTAGDFDKAAAAARGLDIPGNMRMLGRISDSDLAKVFSQALCFLFPSRIEGFGLPAVEAMICGCPVIASSAPCLPEVCGDAALHAGPDDPASWVEAISLVLGDRSLREQMIAKGHSRAERYSWRRIAEQYLALMAQVDQDLDGDGRSG